MISIVINDLLVIKLYCSVSINEHIKKVYYFLSIQKRTELSEVLRIKPRHLFIYPIKLAGAVNCEPLDEQPSIKSFGERKQ